MKLKSTIIDDAFDLSEFSKNEFRSIYVGHGIIIGIIENDEVLVLYEGDNTNYRLKGWEKVIDIAISSCHSNVVIGLNSDGTCVYMITTIDGLASEYSTHLYENIKHIESWKNIVQVSATSDALFGLDKNGMVHHIYLEYPDFDIYGETKRWKEIKKIVTGELCIYGLTRDGSLVYAGERNCGKLDKLNDVEDIVPVGYRSKELVYISNDKQLRITSEYVPGFNCYNKKFIKELKSQSGNFAYALTESNELVQVILNDRYYFFETSEWKNVKCFALGYYNYNEPFIVALCNDEL